MKIKSGSIVESLFEREYVQLDSLKEKFEHCVRRNNILLEYCSFYKAFPTCKKNHPHVLSDPTVQEPTTGSCYRHVFGDLSTNHSYKEDLPSSMHAAFKFFFLVFFFLFTPPTLSDHQKIGESSYELHHFFHTFDHTYITHRHGPPKCNNEMLGV